MRRYAVLGLTLMLSACDEPSTPQGDTRLPLCLGDTPVWAAVRDEGSAGVATGGRWRNASVRDGDVIFFRSPRMSIAYGYVAPEGPSVLIRQVRDDELSVFNCRIFESSDNRLYTVPVTGVPAGKNVLLFVGVGRAQLNGTVFDVSNAAVTPGATRDLLAVLGNTDDQFFGIASFERVIVRRNVDLPSGSTLPTLDFSSNEPRDLRYSQATIPEAGGELVSFLYRWWFGQVLFSTGGSPAPSHISLPSLPDDLLAPSDWYDLNLRTQSTSNAFRGVYASWNHPTDRTFAFGPHLNQFSSAFIPGTAGRAAQLTLAVQPEYQTMLMTSFSQAIGRSYRTVTVMTTAAFRGNDPMWVVDTPNPTLIESTWLGFDKNFPVDIYAQASGGTLPVGLERGNLDFKYAGRSDTLRFSAGTASLRRLHR